MGWRCLRLCRCPEAICGKDVDDIFAYTAYKAVTIRDARLGILHYFFLLCIFAYVVVYQLVCNLGYLSFSAAQNSVRLTLQQPTVDPATGISGCNPNTVSCQDDFTDLSQLSYCCAANSSCQADLSDPGSCKCNYRKQWKNYNCTFLDGSDDAVVKESSILATTYTTVYQQKMNSTCFASYPTGTGRCSKLWLPSDAAEVDGTGEFTADVERYTLLIDHSVNSAGGNKILAARDMHGTLFVGDNTSIQDDLCASHPNATDSPRGMSYGYLVSKAPCYIEPLKVKGLDFFEVGLLLQAMGLTLDNESYPGSGHSVRYDGISTKIMVEYSNTALWHGIVDTYYVYKPMVIPSSTYKVTQLVSTDYPQGRVKKDQHGILFTVLPAGELATESFSQLLLQLTTSLTLIALATAAVNFLAQYVLRWRHYYNEAFYDRTPDFSGLNALDQLPEEELHRILIERGLPTTGTKFTQVLRLLDTGWLPPATSQPSSFNSAMAGARRLQEGRMEAASNRQGLGVAMLAQSGS